MIKMDVIEIIILVEKTVSSANKSSSSRFIIMQESHSCSVGYVFRSLEHMWISMLCYLTKKIEWHNNNYVTHGSFKILFSSIVMDVNVQRFFSSFLLLLQNLSCSWFIVYNYCLEFLGDFCQLTLYSFLCLNYYFVLWEVNFRLCR